jgi:cytosine/adenosine deaminase-related metal-dependent hydrolase
MKHQLLIRARAVVPVSRPPIEDGAILISGQRIAAVGRWSVLSARCSGRAVDLGEVALLPGLVNAHCHLDYTNMAGEFPPPRSFTDWLKLITTAKASWSYSDFAESWLQGARMLLHTGTTTVADMEAVPELLPEVWEATPLRVISFLELIGIKGLRTPAAILQEAVDRIGALGASRFQAGLSPHATYSTLPELLRLSGVAARRRRWRLATHVAESKVEFEMFSEGRGEMFDWLKRSTRDMSDCGLRSPIQHLEHCGLLGENLLAVHVNYLGRNDAALLGRRRVSVVHCPRSHSYFRHEAFPARRLLKAGVNVCLGTDSLASVWKPRRQEVELDLFEEMRTLAKNAPWLSAKAILRMATVNGARALGFKGRLGELSPGALADLIALPFAGHLGRIHELVLEHRGGVAASLIRGRWTIVPSGSSNLVEFAAFGVHHSGCPPAAKHTKAWTPNARGCQNENCCPPAGSSDVSSRVS